MTEDYGKNWKLITEGINNTHFARVIRADHKRPGLLYAGTEYGMYISYDYGAHWKPFQLNLPVVPITDLIIKNNDLVIATQGRAFWVLDDLGVVQANREECLGKRLHIFPINEAYRMSGYVDSNIKNGGMNPPNGVVINYYLKDVTDSSMVSVSIYDRLHKVVKTFMKDAKEKQNQMTFVNGMNRLVWDMQYEPGEKIEGMILWNGFAGGPKAAPGKYSARFRYGADSADIDFVIRGNPNYKQSDEASQEQVDFLIKVRDKFNDIQKAIKNIRSLRNQINELTGKVDTVLSKELKPLADSINKQMTVIEEALYQTKAKAGEDILNFPMRLNDRMSALYNVAASGNNPPTQQVKDAFTELSTETDVQLEKLKKIVKDDLRSFNQLILDKKVQVIKVKD